LIRLPAQFLGSGAYIKVRSISPLSRLTLRPIHYLLRTIYCPQKESAICPNLPNPSRRYPTFTHLMPSSRNVMPGVSGASLPIQSILAKLLPIHRRAARLRS
jgi:hypothetical protein